MWTGSENKGVGSRWETTNRDGPQPKSAPEKHEHGEDFEGKKTAPSSLRGNKKTLSLKKKLIKSQCFFTFWLCDAFEGHTFFLSLNDEGAILF